jgi:hypothetical protein
MSRLTVNTVLLWWCYWLWRQPLGELGVADHAPERPWGHEEPNGLPDQQAARIRVPQLS